MRTVKDIINSKTKAFNSIHPGTLVINALKLLNSINLSYVVVMDDDQYKGIFSERDYSRNVILKGRSSDTTTVAEVMTVDLPVVESSSTVEHCMNLLILHKSRYLLAFDQGRFAGVITIHDLLREVIANKEDVFDVSITRQLIDNEESEKIY